MKFESLHITIDEVDTFINSYIFSARNRRLIREKWYDDITFEELAEKYNLSDRQVKAIVTEAEILFCDHFGIPQKHHKQTARL